MVAWANPVGMAAAAAVQACQAVPVAVPWMEIATPRKTLAGDPSG
ncbi:hypothetical protein [Candidatus Methylacidiphilum infernorum]|nr:hypothetical protein [Candidatus Methylacidiphilum infernorum]